MAADARCEQALRGVDLFADLPPTVVGAIAEQMRTATFAAGEHVVAQGEGASSGRMHVVLAGTADVLVGGEHVASMGPGDHVGELSVLDRSPRDATIVATSDLEVAALASWNLRALILEYPEIALHLLEVVAARLRAVHGRDAPGSHV